jgi:hypothetical protein
MTYPVTPSFPGSQVAAATNMYFPLFIFMPHLKNTAL